MTNINDVKKCREELFLMLTDYYKEDIGTINFAISILDKLITGELKEAGK